MDYISIASGVPAMFNGVQTKRRDNMDLRTHSSHPNLAVKATEGLAIGETNTAQPQPLGRGDLISSL
jgi:hypothetical protein